MADAEACFRQVLEKFPTRADVLHLLGVVAIAMKRHTAGVELIRQAIRHNWNNPDYYANLGAGYSALGQLQEALESFKSALESEWRWKCPSLNLGDRRFDKPVWLGAEPVAGKVVLLHNEQGLGDALQFCRYVPLFRDRGAEVILEIESPLQELFSRLPGISRCLAKGAQLPTFDFHCPLTSLPLAFSTTLDTIPSEVPYLPQASEGAGPQQLGPSERPRVGLVWSGNPNHTNDRNRSLPFRELLPLLDGVAAEFVSLQKESAP
jgi:hypothetical protein